jgi:hypothetical protein
LQYSYENDQHDYGYPGTPFFFLTQNTISNPPPGTIILSPEATYSQGNALSYDANTGMFTVLTTGIYEINFNALAMLPAARPFPVSVVLSSPTLDTLLDTFIGYTGASGYDLPYVATMAQTVVRAMPAGTTFCMKVFKNDTQTPLALGLVQFLFKKLDP